MTTTTTAAEPAAPVEAPAGYALQLLRYHAEELEDLIDHYDAQGDEQSADYWRPRLASTLAAIDTLEAQGQAANVLRLRNTNHWW